MGIDWNTVFDYYLGNLFWKVRPNRRIELGRLAGSTKCNNYLGLKYRKKDYFIHRIVWEMHNGKIPKNLEIDHINRIRDDNRIENLRIVTHQENHMNRTNNRKRD